MKKYISVILTFVMLLTMIPLSGISVNAETVTGACGDNLTWSFASDTGTLTISGTGDMYNYDYAENPWVDYRENTNNVVIENGVTSICDYAFYCFQSITDIVIPDSVKSIGEGALAWCTALTEIAIPNSVTYMGDYAFARCTSLTKITIPGSLKSIEYGIFEDCSSLEEVIISNGVTSIGDYAFGGCTSLKNITIPNSVITIGDGAFSHCTSLEEITIPNGVTSIGNSAFYECEALTDITISDSVASIGDWAFSHCTSLKEIALPNSLTSIGDYTFSHCASLENVTISDTVIVIGAFAFTGCSSLKDITIPNSVAWIGAYAFENCASLQEFAIPDSVAMINDGTFSNCTSLEKVTVPARVSHISVFAFDGCNKEKLAICGYYNTCAADFALRNNITFIAKNIVNENIINYWKNQIRFDTNDDGDFAGTFDYRVLASITSDDLKDAFGSEEIAVEMIKEAGFVLAKGTDVSDFDYETAKKVAMGESNEYTKVIVNYISTALDTDPLSSGAGDYVMSCLVENITEADKNMSLATVAYIAYNDGNGYLNYMFYPATASLCLAESYDKFFPLAFPS